MPRKKILERRGFKKGNTIENNDYIVNLIQNTKGFDCLELRETTIYSDGSEEIVIALKFNDTGISNE